MSKLNLKFNAICVLIIGLVCTIALAQTAKAMLGYYVEVTCTNCKGGGKSCASNWYPAGTSAGLTDPIYTEITGCSGNVIETHGTKPTDKVPDADTTFVSLWDMICIDFDATRADNANLTFADFLPSKGITPYEVEDTLIIHGQNGQLVDTIHRYYYDFTYLMTTPYQPVVNYIVSDNTISVSVDANVTVYIIDLTTGLALSSDVNVSPANSATISIADLSIGCSYGLVVKVNDNVLSTYNFCKE